MSDMLIHPFVIGVAAMFALMRRTNARFGRAVAGFEAVYRFSAGRSARRLIFSRGRVTTRNGPGPGADYDIVFFDLAGSLRSLAKEPNNILRLLAENKLEQTGNLYYLNKLGYLFGLCKRSAKDAAALWKKL